MQNPAPNPGILGRLANVLAAGAKMLGVPEPATAPAPVAAPATRPFQAELIQLRVLASEGRFLEISQIAENSPDYEVVCTAMHLLRVGAQEYDLVALVKRIAAGSSPSCLLSIILLLNLDEGEIATRLFNQKLHSGQLSALLQGGVVRLSHAVDIMSCMDERNGTNTTLDSFTKLIATLQPLQQVHALSEIFGDGEPGGYRYVHDQNDIAPDIKLCALGILMQFPGSVRERPLWYATRERDEVVAYTATVSLVEYWQQGEGAVPANLDPFAMLDVGLLFHLSQLGVKLVWRTDCQTADQRLAALQPLVNEITKALNLPYAELQAGDEDGMAAYGVGTGVVYINPRVLCENEALGEDLMSSLLHELHHMGQDVLIIRSICDDLGLIFGQHGNLLMSLWERYAALVGYAPDHMFLLAVLRLRKDKPLTPDVRKRAERLRAAAQQAYSTNEQRKKIFLRMADLGHSAELLNQGELDPYMLMTLRDMKMLISIFGEKPPESLLYEMQKIKSEIEKWVLDLVATGDIDPRWAQQPIALAEQLFDSDFRQYLEWIVLRLRQLILETIEEEGESLHRLQARVVRLGYHEDEAYAVSDRVEVIAKALLRGWYGNPA